jgi:hypothetical protein
MSLSAIVRQYIDKIRPEKRKEFNQFTHLPSLATAIEEASLAEDQDGKRFHHQRRIKKEAIDLAHDTLVSKEESIRECKRFDELFHLVETSTLPINGIGDLYVYDTALRIGEYLRLKPEKVYLHAGTLIGANWMGYQGKDRVIEVSLFPKEFRELQPSEIEDVLCIYKDIFKKEKWRFGDPS